MKTLSRPARQGLDSDLIQVIEPLASYISAANRPRSVLASALAMLFSQVEEMNLAASAQVTRFVQNRGA